MTNKAHYTAVQNTITVLADLFPACFFVYERRRRPLKIGICEEVIAALAGAATPQEIARALRMYCGHVGYLAACTEGAPRIDLNGEAAGTVSATDAKNACSA